ncbi:2782_t:CDS:2 [Gigaspora rosea]|nr:2782_t:CDS:2 [Gigaspora rosea]
MSNVYILNDIKDREDSKEVGYQLGSICKSELKNALHSSIKFASDLANEYKDLQLANASNTRLRSSKQVFHTKIQLLKSEIKTLKRKATLAQKASSLNKDEFFYPKGEIDKLKAEVEELESEIELECTSHNSNTTPFRYKISELNSLNRILKQKRDILNSKKHELEAEVGRKNFEITSLEAKVNELEKLEQQISQSSHESNIIGGAEADPDSAENSLEKESLLQKTHTHLAEQISKASSEFNKVIGVIANQRKVMKSLAPK